MPQHEKFGGREGEAAYSAFHRSASLSRWMPQGDAIKLAMINIDTCFWIECHDKSYQPIALIETAQDIGQLRKPVVALRNLACRADLPAFCVLYLLADCIDEITGRRKLTSFRVRSIWPNDTPFKKCDPQQYANGLRRLREFGVKNIVTADARSGNGQRRNHDVPRLIRKIEKLSAQMDFWR